MKTFRINWFRRREYSSSTMRFIDNNVSLLGYADKTQDKFSISGIKYGEFAV